MSERLLIDLQEDLADRCRADEYLGPLPILTDRVGAVEAEVSKSLGLVTAGGSNAGICILVLQPLANDGHKGAGAGPLAVDCVFRVLENPVLNNSGKVAHAVAWRIWRIFKHYYAPGLTHSMGPNTPCIVPVKDELAPVAFEVRFAGQSAQTKKYAKVQMPSISASGENVGADITLACTTPGASIYYTEDGKHPYSGQGTLYSAPFVSAGTPIRAAAYLEGYIGSDVAWYDLER